MEKDMMYFDVHRAKINKTIYRPSSNLTRFFKTVISVIMLGNSPISAPLYSKRKMHL